MTAVSKHLRIEGLVQGVSYRAWFHQTASQLGLGGWVRNRADGSVEAVIHGAPELLSRMIKVAHTGPALAKVSGVTVTETIYDESEPFEIRPTA